MPPAACTSPDPPPRRHLSAVPDGSAERHSRVVERLRARIDASDVAPYDGMVWLAHLDTDGKPRLFSRVTDPVAELDELYLLDVLSTLSEIGLPRVTVAIWRGDGAAVAVDRRLARDLAERLPPESGTVLDAVLVVNGTSCRTVRPSRRPSRSPSQSPRQSPSQSPGRSAPPEVP